MTACPYALWLIPAEPERGRITSLIDGIADRFGVFPFEPHATLCSGHWAGEKEELEAIASDLARQIPRFSAKVDGFGQTDDFFTFFFVKLVADDFRNVIEQACHELTDPVLSPAGPHLSLIYSEDEGTIDRVQLRREVTASLPDRITFDALSLVTPGTGDWRDVENWMVSRGSTLGT